MGKNCTKGDFAMSYKLTDPEIQDAETLEMLLDLVETFLDATDVASDAGFKMPPEIEREATRLAIFASDDECEENAGCLLAMLRLADLGLGSAFGLVAGIEGAQEEMLTFVPQDLGSKVNTDLIEKYELAGLAALVQRTQGPNP